MRAGSLSEGSGFRGLEPMPMLMGGTKVRTRSSQAAVAVRNGGYPLPFVAPDMNTVEGPVEPMEHDTSGVRSVFSLVSRVFSFRVPVAA